MHKILLNLHLKFHSLFSRSSEQQCVFQRVVVPRESFTFIVDEPTPKWEIIIESDNETFEFSVSIVFENDRNEEKGVLRLFVSAVEKSLEFASRRRYAFAISNYYQNSSRPFTFGFPIKKLQGIFWNRNKKFARRQEPRTCFPLNNFKLRNNWKRFKERWIEGWKIGAKYAADLLPSKILKRKANQIRAFVSPGKSKKFFFNSHL